MKCLMKEKESESRNLEKVSKIPGKTRHQTDVLTGAVKSLKSQVEALNLKLKEKEGAL